MRLIKKVTSIFAAVVILAGFAVNASAADITWAEIYNSEQSHNERITTLYTGDLSLDPGDIYRFTWEGEWYHGGIGGGDIFVADDDNKVKLFYRDGTPNGPINGNIAMSESKKNPKPFKFVMLFDYTGDSPKAYIDVYDVDKTTLAGTIEVDISALSGIKKIYHSMWNTVVTNYERPVKGSCIMEGDASKQPTPSEVDWELLYSGDGDTREADESAKDVYHDLYAGELSADSDYEILWKTSFYKGGGVNAGQLTFEDENGKKIQLVSKGSNNNTFDGSMTFATLEDTGNPDAVAFTMEVKFSEGICNLKFYDDTKCTKLLGQKTVDISELSGISKIYYYVPDKGVSIYSRPQQSKIEIQKSKILPKVRLVSISGKSGKQVLFGTDAVDLTAVKIEPAFGKIMIDMNTDVDLDSLEEAITLTKKGSDENLISGFTQDNYVVTATVSGELSENSEYILKVDDSVLSKKGLQAEETFSLSFVTGKKQMKGKMSNAQIADGKITADVSFTNSADSAKSWSFIVSCYDKSGRLIWSGAYSDGEDVSDTLSAKATVELPNGELPEGTAKVKAYLWDSLMLTEMYSDSMEIR